MPTLVHLADERHTSKILNGGIRIGKYQSGIYCMPVLQNFYVTHQWLRELKRGGVKTFVGVYFRVDSSQLVYAGKYNSHHKHISLGQAIKEIMSIDDPLGYELIIDRKIEPSEIVKVKNLPQTLGWRYKPYSHGIKPCPCEFCIKTSMKAESIRKRLDVVETVDSYETIVDKIKLSKDDDEVRELLYKIARKNRRSDPGELFFVVNKYSKYVDDAFANVLRYYRHPNAEKLLLKLILHSDPQIRQTSARSILKIRPQTGMEILKRFCDDPEIRKVIDEE
jgi:hypothetical protein